MQQPPRQRLRSNDVLARMDTTGKATSPININRLGCLR
jgi:hypothetical protein